MNKTILVLALILLIFGGFFVAVFFHDVSQEVQFAWVSSMRFLRPLPVADIQVDGHQYHVEVAATNGARERGLMFCRTLAAGSGMLFLFPDAAPYAFWMKNTYVALDILWIQDDVVVDIAASVPSAVGQEEPPSYAPGAPADMVLELPAGTAAADGLRIGDAVRIFWNGAAPQAR